MKRIIMGIAVIAATLLSFQSCKKNQTPETDNTKLWPAYDASCKRYGFIDKSGKFKISPIFNSASNFFSCGYAVVTMDKNQCFIDKNGNIKYSISNGNIEPFYYNYARIYQNSKYGMLNKKFEYSISPIYDYLGYMSYNGLVLAKAINSDYYSYVDGKGKEKISAKFKGAETFYDGHAVASYDGEKNGLIGTDGNFDVQPTYDDLYYIGHSRWAASTGNDYVTMIDAKGNSKGIFYDLDGSIDDENLFYAKNAAGKVGFVNKDGKEVISFQFDGAYNFCEGYCAVYNGTDDNRIMKLIDKKGNVQFTESGFRAYSPMHNGLILLYKYNTSDYSTTYKWVDKKGKTVYSWIMKSGYYAPARAEKAEKAEKPEWKEEASFVLGE